MVAAYRDGHSAAEWERRKPARPPRDGREIRKREVQSIFDAIVPGIGNLPKCWQEYRGARIQAAFVMGWVDGMNGRDAQPKTGDKIAPLETQS
jgi:hypothetical protein